MIQVTEMVLQQDGNMVAVEFDGKYIAGAPIALLDDQWIERKKQDLEAALVKIAALKKQHMGGNILMFPGPKVVDLDLN